MSTLARVLAAIGVLWAATGRADPLFTTSPSLTCYLEDSITNKIVKTSSKSMTDLVAKALLVDPSVAATLTIAFDAGTGLFEIVDRCSGDLLMTFAAPVYCSGAPTPGGAKSTCSYAFSAGGESICRLSQKTGARIVESGNCEGPIDFLVLMQPCVLQIKISKPFVTECPG
ncbi:MAG TPA: hypothetical protein VMR50_06595 [Myxococcota bacterium]|nr:hypothetical protein [Myxococcota bacterium]